MNQFELHQGNSLEILRGIPDNSIDSICTDPPYGLSDHKPGEVLECLTAWIAGKPYAPKGKGFMGKSWDAWVPGPEIWRECLRVLKPGGHVLAFAGTRSMDLMSMAIRLAGFELRDAVGYAHDDGGAPLAAWVYGSGFPKSRDVSKAIDSETGAARQWQGWGSALKPAWEPIIMARKPLEGTIAANVLKHGAGALNIVGCRVDGEKASGSGKLSSWRALEGRKDVPEAPMTSEASGRWPANVIHDGSDAVLAEFPQASDQSSAARFFYCAKASKADRNAGLDGFSEKQYSHDGREKPIDNAYQRNASASANHHPTVKPTALMAYLVRLVTPPGGTVLDPFMGSGSTGKACMREGFGFIGIDLSTEYVAIARARIEHELATVEAARLAAEAAAMPPPQIDLFGT